MSMNQRHISIKISGTPVKKGGFIPIVNINDACFDIHDSYPASLTRDACLYSVSVMPDITVYKLVFNRMRHSDGAAAGLIIGFSIPADSRLPDGNDSAGVLHSILEAFVGSFAVALPDGSFEYRFGRFDTSGIENICSSIELVSCDGNSRTAMKDGDPRGAIEVPANRIAKTLDDIGSVGVDNISELLIGEHINMSLAGIAVSLQNKEQTTDSIYSEDVCMANASVVCTDTTDGDSDDIAAATSISSDDTGPVSPILPVDAGMHPSLQTEGDKVADSFVVNANYADIYDTRHRRIWPALLAGIFLGAVVALAVVGVLRKDAEPIDRTVVTPADTTVVPAVDTLAPTSSETVYVEKKIIVEVASKRAKSKVAPKVSTPEQESSSTSAESAQSQEIRQAPQLKYDPEAERSL